MQYIAMASHPIGDQQKKHPTIAECFLLVTPTGIEYPYKYFLATLRAPMEALPRQIIRHGQKYMEI